MRNAADYYAVGLALANAAGKTGDAATGDATVVVAPQFLIQADAALHRLSDRYLRWSRGWEEGAPAQSAASSATAPGSYDVLDDVVAKLSNAQAFPALKRIVFVGHGGGAQMLARYAVVMHPRPGPPVSFVIANAGTYLYPIAQRPVPLDLSGFQSLEIRLGSAAALRGRRRPDREGLRGARRDALLGAKDRKTSGILDQSCAAQAQGPNRLERGRYFAKQMTASGIAPRLRYVIVPGTGHNEKAMLLSSEATAVIFPAGDAGR